MQNQSTSYKLPFKQISFRAELVSSFLLRPSSSGHNFLIIKASDEIKKFLDKELKSQISIATAATEGKLKYENTAIKPEKNRSGQETGESILTIGVYDIKAISSCLRDAQNKQISSDPWAGAEVNIVARVRVSPNKDNKLLRPVFYLSAMQVVKQGERKAPEYFSPIEDNESSPF